MVQNINQEHMPLLIIHSVIMLFSNMGLFKHRIYLEKTDFTHQTYMNILFKTIRKIYSYEKIKVIAVI